MRSRTAIPILPVALALVAVAQADPTRPNERGKAALLAMKDNLERLEYCRAKYSETVGKTTDWPDAMAGKFWKREPGGQMYPNTGTTKVVKDGERVTVAITPDAESLDRRRNPQLSAMKEQPGLMIGTPVAFSPDEYVCSESGVLTYSPGFRGEKAEAPDSVCLNRHVHDHGFNFWVVEKYRVFFTSGKYVRAWTLFQASERGEATITCDSTDYRGTACERVRFRVTAGKERDYEYEFLLDPTQGYLPVRMIWTHPKEKHEVGRFEITNAKRLPNGCWFPERLVSGFTQGNGFWLCREFTLAEMDVSRRPTKAELSIRLPAGSAVKDCDGDPNGKWVMLKQAEDIHPDDLPRLLELTRLKQADPLADTALPPARGRWWPWLAGAGGLLIAAALLWRRRVRRARAAGPPPPGIRP